MTTTALPNLENVPERSNRLGIEGIEFIEYTTDRPQALGQVLERMGFRPVARHRSREVTLYRQGSMNLVVNAHTEEMAGDQPVISAVALRVRNALAAHTRCMELGVWPVPSQAQAMELCIPAIRGPGGSRFYFVDRWRDFSIYDIDFTPIPSVEQHPAALADMSYFGVVQYIGSGRSVDWITYYERLFDFRLLPDEERFGIMPKGKLMRSPCGSFLWQLIEPEQGLEAEDKTPELLQRIGLGTADVEQTVQVLKQRGVEFVEMSSLHPDDRGALTRYELGAVAFELVHRDN